MSRLPLRARDSAPASMRIAVISPFLDRSHGTERVIIEQLENFPGGPENEIHIYAQCVQDLRGVAIWNPDQRTPSTSHLFWHSVPSVPGPHLLQYIFWLFANTIRRSSDRSHDGTNYDVTYSPGINAFDVDAIAVHIVFHEFHHQVIPELDFRKTAVSDWPRLIHRRLYYRLVMALEKKVYRNPKVSLAAVSSLVAQQLEKYFQRKDVRIIGNGVDVEYLSPSTRLAIRSSAREQFGLSAADFTLLLIGNDWKKKGLDALLRALAEIQELPWMFIVVGNDERAPYESVIRRYQMSHRVIFLAPSPDVLKFYAAADAYVGPSLEDAYGLPVLEAMACGLPVLTSSRAGVSEIIDDGINGIILRDPRNTRELLSRLRHLIIDPVLCRRLGSEAARTAQNHTWARNAQSTWGWLNEVAREEQNTTRQFLNPGRIDQDSSSSAAPVPDIGSHRPRALPALTGIRFFAAFYVVLGHSLPWLENRFRLPWPVKIFLSNGYLAVALFFLLSGFILAYTYENQIVSIRNRLHFFEARFARIYPVYLLSLILAYWFEQGLQLKTRIAVLSMVQAWNPLTSITGAWNYPAWTLSVEAFFYICFPFALPWLSRQSNAVLRSMSAVFLLISVLAHTPVMGLGLVPACQWIPLPILRLPEFLLGVVLGLCFLRSARTPQGPSHSLRVSAAVAGMLAALSLPLGSWVSLVMMPYAVLIYELAFGFDWLAKILSTRLIVLLGGASYAIYLLQLPVRSWTRTIFEQLPAAAQPFGAPLTPLILVLFSIAVFRFWEEPARRMLRRWFAALESVRTQPPPKAPSV